MLDRYIEGDRQVERATRVGAGHHVGPRPADHLDLLVAYRAGQFGMDHRERPAGAAAATVVVELHNLVDIAGEQLANRHVGPLHMAEMAGVLHRHPQGEAPPTRQGHVRHDPLMDVVHPAGKCRSVGRAEQMPVVLQQGPAARRVDEDRLVTRVRRHGATRQVLGLGAQTGVVVQSTTATARTPRKGDAHATSVEDRDHVAVDVALPGIHHATGEQHHVGPGRAK